MSASDQDLAGLHDDVREAIEMVESMERDLHDDRAPSSTLRTDFARLTRENAELLHLPDRIRELRKAEVELAALKTERDALKSALAKWDQWIKDGMHIALLPVGGE